MAEGCALTTLVEREMRRHAGLSVDDDPGASPSAAPAPLVAASRPPTTPPRSVRDPRFGFPKEKLPAVEPRGGNIRITPV
jgi:hypothetical protein